MSATNARVKDGCSFLVPSNSGRLAESLWKPHCTSHGKKTSGDSFIASLGPEVTFCLFDHIVLPTSWLVENDPVSALRCCLFHLSLPPTTEWWMTCGSASNRPGSQTPRRSCGSALDPHFRIGSSSARKVQTRTKCRSDRTAKTVDETMRMEKERVYATQRKCVRKMCVRATRSVCT